MLNAWGAFLVCSHRIVAVPTDLITNVDYTEVKLPSAGKLVDSPGPKEYVKEDQRSVRARKMGYGTCLQGRLTYSLMVSHSLENGTYADRFSGRQRRSTASQTRGSRLATGVEHPLPCW